MTDSLPSRLAGIAARKTLDDPDIGRSLLALLVEMFEASGGRIYTLDLATGYYRSAAQIARTGKDAQFDARRLRHPNELRWGALEQAAFTKEPTLVQAAPQWPGGRRQQPYGSRLVMPVLRGGSVVGLVDLNGEASSSFEASDEARVGHAEAAMQQLSNSLEARSVHRILEKTAAFKVALHKRQDEVVRNLMRFLGESSGMQYVALRKLEPGTDTLTCIGIFGFPDEMAPATLTIQSLADKYPPFSYVVEHRDHWVARDVKGKAYANIRARGELADIRSFVACPVLVGEELWGVLSFGAAVEYGYSELEAFSLRALANLAGVALDAAQNAEDAARTHYDDGRLMQAVLSNEVVVASRHEMYDQIEIVGTARSALLDVLRPLNEPRASTRLTRKDLDTLFFQIKGLDAAHGQLNKVLETIRFTQTVGEQEAGPVRVAQAWDRALEPFAYRMSRSSVQRVHSDVPVNQIVSGSFDWLRIVFMHLILNSLDAFDREYQKGRRELGLKVQASGSSVVLRYWDNAGGIVPGTLQKRGIVLDQEPRHVIFERYVTSKAKGTGLGLASCRAALEQMGGSIDLVDWRRGITFDIELPRWND